MKIVDKKKVASENFSLAEYQALAKMSHPNIIRLHEIIDDPKEPYVYLVMDQLKGGTLQSRLKNAQKDKITTEQLRGWMQNIASALHYCHVSQKICHLDIKPDNIMLNAAGEAILCDFGSALLFKQSNDKFAHTVGTPKFYAPE
jgi:serine/threonine protein kinase